MIQNLSRKHSFAFSKNLDQEKRTASNDACKSILNEDDTNIVWLHKKNL